jgi:hypothetical protein
LTSQKCGPLATTQSKWPPIFSRCCRVLMRTKPIRRLLIDTCVGVSAETSRWSLVTGGCMLRMSLSSRRRVRELSCSTPDGVYDGCDEHEQRQLEDIIRDYYQEPATEPCDAMLNTRSGRRNSQMKWRCRSHRRQIFGRSGAHVPKGKTLTALWQK